MTVLHSGTTIKYSENWEQVFGTSKKKSAPKKRTAKKKPQAKAKKGTSRKKS